MTGTDKVSIRLTNRVSFLSGVATARRNYILNTGYNGQEKFLIIKSYSGAGNEPKIWVKTKQNDNTIFTASKEGQVLHLISDGTYWYPLNGISTAGTNDPGDWTTN